MLQPSGYFPKCCDNCRSFSGIDVGDDAHPECPKGCLQCRVVQTSPAKTFRCADYRGDSDDTCGPPCKKN
uniref:Bowman-Birk serine protease inhibitors family domain-containing protein n=1 Tax=Aegilops tauschii subsp. strangulata TaxID=200361 RepID=A0A452Z618_AEGTS